MKDVKLRRIWLSLGAAVCSLVVLWLATSALAQAPPVGGVAAVQAATSATGTVASQVSYQGALQEDGLPVDGTRAMTFTLHADDACTTELQEVLTGTVAITNGIFTVALEVDQSHFDGQALWVGLNVEGTDLACQEILPVPYALSLRPGAVISGTAYWDPTTDAATLKVQSYVGRSAVFGYSPSGYGLRGEGLYGVLAQGHGPYGVNAWCDYGTGVSANSYEGIGMQAGSFISHPLVAMNLAGPEEVFRVERDGDVYADGAYNCGLGSGSDSEPGTCIIQNSPADFAEMLPSAANLEPGDVLIVDTSGALARSTEPYQTTVVGVYSTDPGYLGGGEHSGQEGYAPLAIVGIVPVKATAENGPIQPGDLLASSSTPGHAMRADPPILGAIVGKALEGLDEETGVIMMLVMLQ